jgi:hypothetical protein
MVTYLHVNSKNRSDKQVDTYLLINFYCCRNPPPLIHHGQCPSTSSDLNDYQARGASIGAVGCLKYVEDFEILETIGKGFFGVVYKVWGGIFAF